MIRVLGYDRGISYSVEINPDATVRPAERGIITHAAPLDVLTHVVDRVGEVVPVTSTGPDVAIDLNNATSILAALQQSTEVTTIAGDLPADWPVSEEGVVY